MKKQYLPLVAVLALLMIGMTSCLSGSGDAPIDYVNEPYLIDTSIQARAQTFENLRGEKGAGGQEASNLGVGRKGSPAKILEAGETFTFFEEDQPGCIRHIWITTRSNPENMRSLVIRGWWDGQEHPSIECPLGDFMGLAHGKVMAHQTAVHSIGERAGMNFWLPMPFTKSAKLEVTNENDTNIVFFYQVDYTIGDQLPEDVGRLHVLFRRENPTTMKEDFELLPKRTGKGRYVGAVIGIRSLGPHWWGEGEMKAFIDGDTEFPTIAGTGSEDYVGLSWGMQQTPYMYNGCNLNQHGFVTMYRWHLPDPIVWENDIRITIQQIGHRGELFERSDDWSTATFFYQPIPSDPLPELPNHEARLADLWAPPAAEE